MREMLRPNPTAAVAARGNDNKSAGRYLAVLRTLASCAVLIFLCAPSVFADTGPIWNGNASNLASIVRAVLGVAAGIVTILGVFFAIKAIKNFGSDKEWGNQAGACLLCFALTTVIAVIWALSQGKVVDVVNF
jgi:hypothetical protein